MREIPILYSTPMVIAKLAGRKTQTRRTTNLDEINQNPDEWSFYGLTIRVGTAGVFAMFTDVHGEPTFIRCPYGEPGDVLYGRETWCNYPMAGNDGAPGVIFKADHPDLKAKWKPGIHMFKKDARIWDRVVDVRVERLQEISEGDSRKEGVEKQWYDDHGETPGRDLYFVTGVTKEGFGYPSAVEVYKDLWSKINGPGSWAANPFVWVIETETISTTGRPVLLTK